MCVGTYRRANSGGVLDAEYEKDHRKEIYKALACQDCNLPNNIHKFTVFMEIFLYSRNCINRKTNKITADSKKKKSSLSSRSSGASYVCCTL